MIGEIWRHKKRGTTYEIVSDSASMQCSAAPKFEALFADEDWIVYRSTDTAVFYVRPRDEFLDGRFERIGDGNE